MDPSSPGAALDDGSAVPGGTAGDEVFPLRERYRFRDRFGLALVELSSRSRTFRELPKGPWSLFIAIAAHWQSNAEAWPGQEALARFTRSTTRSVREHSETLEKRGVIRRRREPRGDGSERIYYAPGPVTLTELATFARGYPDARATPPGLSTPRPSVRPTPSQPLSGTPPEPLSGTRVELLLSHAPAEALSGGPPELPSRTPPEATSGELRDLRDHRELSSCAQTPAHGPAKEQEPSALDRQVARDALAEHRRRRFPNRSGESSCLDARDIDMVALTSRAVAGDRDAKFRAQCDAITGAFESSKDGPPTVSYIWNNVGHFLEHEERGRSLRNRDQDRDDRRSATSRATDADRLWRRAPWIPRKAPVAFVQAIRRGDLPVAEAIVLEHERHLTRLGSAL